MSRPRTIGFLRERLRRHTGQGGNSGAYKDADLNEDLVEAWEWVWHRLVSSREGYGEIATTLSGQAGDTAVALPTDFLDLRSIFRRSAVASNRVDEPEYLERRAYRYRYPSDTVTVHRPGCYWIEGPDSITPSGQRLELRPALDEGETIEISYVCQAPVWPLVEDANSPGTFVRDATAVVDLIAEPIERALIWIAATIALQRDDVGARAEAEAKAMTMLDEVSKRRGRRNSAAPNTIDRYQRPGYWR